MALTAREKTEKLLKDSGWEPNPARTVQQRGRYNPETRQDEWFAVQDPCAWMKLSDKVPGIFYLYLQHQETSYGYRKRGTNNTLKSAHLTILVDGQDSPADVGLLTQPKAWRHDAVNYGALDQEDRELSLRDRTNLIIKDVDLAAWLMREAEHEDGIAKAKAADERKADRIARSQPLPITIPLGSGSWENGSFKRLAYKAKDVADDLERADGKSDLPALVAELHKAVAAITEALDDEASLRVGEILAEHVNELVSA